MKNPASAAPRPDLRQPPRCVAVVAAALFALTLTGCLGASAPPERLFRLSDPAPPGTPAKAAISGTLVVEGFQARGALARERNILFRDLAEANETQFYPASQWEELPATMIQTTLANCLDRAGLFESVTSRDRRFRPRYALAGTLDQLEQRVAGACSDALIRVQMSLIDEEDHRMVLRGVYQAAEPVAGSRIDQALPAFDRALTRICAAMVADMRRLKPGGPAITPSQPRNEPAPACAR